MKQPAHIAHHNKIEGFTLLELLIALILISVGILGHAKMQMSSKQIAQQANYSQAANSALLDLAQRLKANKVITQATEFNFTNLNDGIAPTLNDCIASSTCTKEQFVNYELNEWFTNLALPQPRFSIANNGPLFTLLLTWDAGRTGAGSDKCDTLTGHQCGEINLWIR